LTGLIGFPLLAWLTSLLLKLQISIVGFLAKMPWGSIEISQYDARVFLVWPLIIAAAIIMFHATQHRYRPAYTLEKSQKNGKI
jgi:hypothetical protein